MCVCVCVCVQLFPDLDKVVFLDDDVVVQHDLSPLWDLDLNNKVVGAVVDSLCGHEYCCKYKDHFNFTDPIISSNLDQHLCGWLYGMNIFDLKRWRNSNITATYHKWLKLVSIYIDRYQLMMYIHVTLSHQIKTSHPAEPQFWIHPVAVGSTSARLNCFRRPCPPAWSIMACSWFGATLSKCWKGKGWSCSSVAFQRGGEAVAGNGVPWGKKGVVQTRKSVEWIYQEMWNNRVGNDGGSHASFSTLYLTIY